MRAIRILPALLLSALFAGSSYSNRARAEETTTADPTATSDDPGDDLAHAVKLSISDRGPGRPWLFKIENQGENTLSLVGDTRLLWFEVKVPGQKKSVECRLPKTMQRTKAHHGSLVRLAPGEDFVRHFDPRFYCFADGDQRVLVPGAILIPHFGWADDTKVSWHKGKRVVTVLPATPPLVLSTVIEPPSETAAKTDADAGAPEETPAAPADDSEDQTSESPLPTLAGIRHIDGQPLALDSRYAKWSASRIRPNKPTQRELRMRVVKGSDADTERDATLTIGMTDQSTEPLRLYFRRELLSFEVIGPEGTKTCARDDTPREPEHQAFLTLLPGREMQITTRLLEVCPRGTFGKPGFYLVNASLNASYSGEAFGIDAFVGEVSAMSPKPIRIRKSEEPYLVTTPMPPNGVPAASPAVAAPTPQPPPAPPTPAAN